MLDNIAGLVLLVSMLTGIYGFPVDFALAYMVPGTAIGVLVGDLLFFGLAFLYARRTGLTNVTAMPLGLDTPSSIGMVLLVLGPSYTAGLAEGLDPQEAAMQTWHIGICAIMVSGIVKAALAPCCNWLHRIFPRAGLLGSLAAIALLLIAFTQMTELAASPLVGFARQALPFKIPGALGAVLAGCLVYYVLLHAGQAVEFDLVEKPISFGIVWFPQEWLTAFTFEWVGSFGKVGPYLGYVIPFAIATVIGGIDCAESAAAVGDDFKTSRVIGIEAIATMLAALCGGVVQTTPYIGHPAYKAMGGRAAYTLATALFIGGAGLIGYFGLIFFWIPEAAVLPILVFIGLEITAQSFQATPRRHYAALAMACIPATAKLVMINVGRFIPYMDIPALPKDLQNLLLYLSVLAGGFILTSLIWASATAKIIDRDFSKASGFLSLGGVFTLFGLMHSPLQGDKVFWPWELFDAAKFSRVETTIVLEFAGAYLLMALLVVGLGAAMAGKSKMITTDEEYEQLV
jgi:AGZA family xanthine/uracil permease-like MFS transporter